MNYKILHISPHLGGGVGRVLTNYLKYTKKDEKSEHKIYCLDSINQYAQDFLYKESIIYKELVKHHELLDEISGSDIVVIHWWNHPLLYEFLVKRQLPPSRVIMWSHVSGAELPQIFTKPLLDYADKFIFTTPMSYLTEEVKNYQHKNKLSYIWATAGLDYVRSVEKKEHNTFNIGYIGALDFSKMYDNFVELCSKIDIPNVKFIVCGDGCDKDKLIEQTKKFGIEDKFEFTGFVDNIIPYLEIFDIFGYPLNKNHYGTCDQVLAEAMGCGIVPVTFDNNMENYMVHNMYNGITVRSEHEYIDAINLLYINKEFYTILSKNSRANAMERFSLEFLVEEWDKVFNAALSHSKTIKKWGGTYSGDNVKPHEIFVESIGQYGIIFDRNDNNAICNLLNSSLSFKSKTKGSIYHYCSFFEDIILKHWEQIHDK